nr:2786_t:CDS:2 [Entrophospora candida]
MRLEVCQPDEMTYSLMIHACAKEKNAEKAFDLYKEMLEQGLKLTGITYNSLIDACSKRKDIFFYKKKIAFDLVQEMKEHGCSPDLITYNSLMYACAINKDLKLARNLFISIIQSLIENKSSFDSLLKIYKEIIPKHQVELSSWIFLHMLNACYKYNRFSLAWDVWNDFLGWSREESERIFKDFKNVYQQKMEFERIGLTEELEYKLSNNIHSSMKLIKNLSNKHKPKLKDFRLLLTRIKESDELGDETAKRYKREVITLCNINDKENRSNIVRNRLNKKWNHPKNLYYNSNKFNNKNLSRKFINY